MSRIPRARGGRPLGSALAASSGRSQAVPRRPDEGLSNRLIHSPSRMDSSESTPCFLYDVLVTQTALVEALRLAQPLLVHPARAEFYHVSNTLQGATIGPVAHDRYPGIPTPRVDGYAVTLGTRQMDALLQYLGDKYTAMHLEFVVGSCSVSGFTFVLRNTPTHTMFFYGTLTDPETLRAILSLPPTETPVLRPAFMTGDQWDFKQWMHYSYAFGDATGAAATVRGCLYECSDEAQLSLLQEYETSYYRLCNVQVTDENDRVVNASCFVWDSSADCSDPGLGD